MHRGSVVRTTDRAFGLPANGARSSARRRSCCCCTSAAAGVLVLAVAPAEYQLGSTGVRVPAHRAVAGWQFGRIEEKWSAAVAPEAT